MTSEASVRLSGASPPGPRDGHRQAAGGGAAKWRGDKVASDAGPTRSFSGPYDVPIPETPARIAARITTSTTATTAWAGDCGSCGSSRSLGPRASHPTLLPLHGVSH